MVAFTFGALLRGVRGLDNHETLDGRSGFPPQPISAPLTSGLAGLAAHNEEVAKANTRIGELKKQSAATNPETLEAELRRFRNMEIRQQPKVRELVEKLAGSRNAKKEIEKQKVVKKELTATATKVLAKYETFINRLLKLFGANFSIVNAKPNFAGGKASSTYQLELNQTQLDIGDARTPRGKPCFRTALSTGDKSTLALAFFLARLEQEDIYARFPSAQAKPRDSADAPS